MERSPRVAPICMRKISNTREVSSCKMYKCIPLQNGSKIFHMYPFTLTSFSSFWDIILGSGVGGDSLIDEAELYEDNHCPSIY